MKNKATAIKIISLSILSIFTAITLIISGHNNSVSDIRTRALFEDNPNFCQESCEGRKRCDFNDTSPVPGDPNYNDPCCVELGSTGNAYACSWPQRGYCTDTQCGAIPDGAPRERCGGPRHSWCNECISHNCPGYGKTTPTTAPQPTSAPQPTTSPTIIPTNLPEVTQPPVVQPTQTSIQPTSAPFVQLTPAYVNFQTQQHGNETTTQGLNLLNLMPKINFPDLKFTAPKINVDELQRGIAKPLDILESIFGKIVYYDRQLENGINEKVKNIFNF